MAALFAALLGARTVRDPGVRPDEAPIGQPLRGLTSSEMAYFSAGLTSFQEVEDVAQGLGPTFNLDSCAGCHAYPAVGGSSPFMNPQIAVAVKNGAVNRVPAFLKPDGPVRVVRFPFKPGTNTRDGGVHGLFSIAGRADAPGCAAAQTDFDRAAQAGNAIFRIPTPLFGAGLMEAIPDSTIVQNMNANTVQKAGLRIGGHPNHNANDGTITRFGWKAQNGSLLLFAAEAYNVEMGVSNELFPQERDAAAGCVFNAQPEDGVHLDRAGMTAAFSDIALFTAYMRYLDAPAPQPETPSIARGREVFQSVGCALCHTPSLTTGTMASAALSGRVVTLYSDLLLHRMGGGLADNVVQGEAGPDEFRTAPLWGAGQRIFFLHDGRTADLLEAIRAHGGEAGAVVQAFMAQAPERQQDLLSFVRSL